MAARVTIKSIAQDLGISHMTVSRALSNHPNVQEETRRAIIAHADKLGYVRSAAAATMRGDGSRIIGLLLPNILNDFYARLANALALACEQSGYHLIIHLTNDDINTETRDLQRLREVEAKAVLMVPAPGSTANSTPLLANMHVIQLIRQRPMAQPANTIVVQDHDAIVAAVAHLAQQGHRKIGFIGAHPDMSSGRERFAAFHQGLKQSALDLNPDIVITDTPNFEMGRQSAQRLLNDGSATALVCAGVEISNGALNAMMESGRADFGFVGYGDPPFYAWLNGGVSTIHLPVSEIAEQALTLLQEDTRPSDTYGYAAKLVVR